MFSQLSVLSNELRYVSYKQIIYYLNVVDYLFMLICDKLGSNNDTIFKEEEATEILKSHGLINNINE